MKKLLPTALVLCLAASAIFCGLWLNARKQADDLELLCQASANRAYQCFQEYAERGSEGDYWQGVSAFYTFQQSFHLLTENTNRRGDYVYCNIVYGYLILDPEDCQAHIKALCDAVGILANNWQDPNGCLRLAELGNLLSHS